MLSRSSARTGTRRTASSARRRLYVYISLSLSLCIYIYIYVYVYVYVYIYIYIYVGRLQDAPGDPRAAGAGLGEGRMGSALLGSLQCSCFLTGKLFGCYFLGAPVNLLLSSQKCQGVPFFAICQTSLLLQRPH